MVANSWSFGDGITSSILSPTHTYSTGGTFIVKLVITSAAGCKDSVTQSVNVNGLPVPNFTIIGATNCTNNLTLSFTNTSTGASNYNWSFGDGNTSSLTNPTYAYAVAGTYTIKLVATSANGCVDSTKQTVTFTTNPVASYTVNNTSQCVNNNSFVL
ncbi:PKD domain-containing protein, partial [bacterium]|nr:PKD domain-containing protein [bacterium]